jgi:DnaD/phage-associated family protein
MIEENEGKKCSNPIEVQAPKRTIENKKIDDRGSAQQCDNELDMDCTQTCDTTSGQTISFTNVCNNKNRQPDFINDSNNKDRQASDSNDANNSRQASTEIPEEFNCIEFKDIIVAYESNFHFPTATEIDYLKDWNKLFNSEIIIHAIQIAVNKDKRNIHYVNGILRNWKEQGVKCLQDVKDIEQKARKTNKSNREYGSNEYEAYDNSSALKVIDYGEYDPQMFKI